MKHRSTKAARFALQGVAWAAACLCSLQAQALGLGRLSVQSALGETLKAEIEVSSITQDEAASLRLRVAPPEVYRAAGVDYNAVLPGTQVTLVRRPDGRSVLRVQSERVVQEPFVEVMIEATWSSGRLVREYTMLFDPPGSRLAQAPAAATTAPVIAPAPAPAQPLPPVAAPRPAPPPVAPPPAAAPAPRPAPAPAAAAAPRPAPAPAAAPATATAEQVRVRGGDTLSRIAERSLRPGVSLDQMLVSLFRGNPQAFMGDNMNRLKAGAVLSVPSAEQAGAMSPEQAREIVIAQSADFDAYRQRLAAGTTTAADNAPARQAGGQVQVQDRKQAAAPSPDRLTLSQGGVKPVAPGGDPGARLAELARNVEELRKLQQGGAAAPAASPAPAAANPPGPATAPPAAPAPAPAPAAGPAPAPTPAVTPAPAPATPAVATPAPKPPAPPPVAADEPGLVDSLMDSPLLLPAAGVLVALLGGFGLWRLRARRRPAGETSFLESRLQPDSFFGASGGQRVDTHETAAGSSGTSSSMSYSLSQLDAIGDVDPVAEADVYLAYGRDLQAEEILKEAMRSNPERMAIRSKLLEVYAKRRDTKGFELLATQMHNLLQGQGEDWTAAQALGRSIDPDNPLYQPGGRPDEVLGSAGQPIEPLGASTVPHEPPAAPPAFQPAADATLDGGLDLDLSDHMPLSAPETTQALSTGAEMPPEPPPAAPAAPAADNGMIDFDLDSLAAPLDEARPAAAPAADPTLDFGSFGVGDAPAAGPESAIDDDPLARKLELAEEFRQIGDLEGARDLLEEVVAKADGALRAKAQGMLDSLE